MPIVVVHVSMLCVVAWRRKGMRVRSRPGRASSMASRVGPTGIVRLALHARWVSWRVGRLIVVVRRRVRVRVLRLMLRLLVLRLMLLVVVVRLVVVLHGRVGLLLMVSTIRVRVRRRRQRLVMSRRRSGRGVRLFGWTRAVRLVGRRRRVRMVGRARRRQRIPTWIVRTRQCYTWGLRRGRWPRCKTLTLGVWRTGFHVARDADTVRLEYYIGTVAALRLMLGDGQGYE